MELEQRVTVSQQPINEKGDVEYVGLDNQKGTVVGQIGNVGRFSVRLDPTEERPTGIVLNFRPEDLSLEKPPSYTK